MRVSARIGLLLTLATLMGCGSTMIPGTRVEDTPSNRAVFNVVEAYRMAIEERDMKRVRNLVSLRYYENASSTDTNDDDYGYTELEGKVIPVLRDNIKKVQYRIKLRKISIHGNRATAEFEYYWKFQYSEGGRENWVARNDFNRLDFVREDGVWKIIAGL